MSNGLRYRCAGLFGLAGAVALLAMAQGAFAKKPVTPTGPLLKTCGEAWVGFGQPSEACAVLWWDASTKQISAQCTVEYSFSGVTTYERWCYLEAGKNNKPGKLEESTCYGCEVATEANETYTWQTPGLVPTTKGKTTYSVVFRFIPRNGVNKENEGPEVGLRTPFLRVKARK
jgi:hypothetical protein